VSWVYHLEDKGGGGGGRTTIFLKGERGNGGQGEEGDEAKLQGGDRRWTPKKDKHHALVISMKGKEKKKFPFSSDFVKE